MTVWVPHQEPFSESQLSIWYFNHAGGYEGIFAATQALSNCACIASDQRGLPVDKVIRARIGWDGAAISWRQILEKFNPRSSLSAKGRNAKVRAEHIVQVFLLRSVVFAFPCDFEPQHIPVEFQTGVGVADDDGRVIDAEKEFVGWTVPFGIAFIRGELEDFQRVAIGIGKVERSDSGGVFVPIR